MVYKNEKILAETATDKSCFPSGVLSFSEAALYVCEGIEVSYNKMFEDIGINELAVYESTGNIISYVSEDGEAASSENKKLHERVIEWFKTIWGKIKGFFEDALAKFKKVIVDNKAKIAAKFNAADISKLPDKVYGKVSDYTEFDNSVDVGYADQATGLMNEISHEFDSCKGEGFMEKAKEVYEKYSKTLAGKLLNLSSEIEGADGMKKYIKGLVKDPVDCNKQYLSNNLKEMVEFVFSDSPIKKIHTMYKGDRKVIDTAISDVKKRVNDAKKDDSVVSFAQYEYRLFKDISQLILTENACILDVMRKRMSEYRGVLFRVALAMNKGAKETTTSESVDLFASQVAMVEGTFAW